MQKKRYIFFYGIYTYTHGYIHTLMHAYIYPCTLTHVVMHMHTMKRTRTQQDLLIILPQRDQQAMGYTIKKMYLRFEESVNENF
jgi:hypothetical protein